MKIFELKGRIQMFYNKYIIEVLVSAFVATNSPGTFGGRGKERWREGRSA